MAKYPIIFPSSSKGGKTLATTKHGELVVIDDMPYLVIEDATAVVKDITYWYDRYKEKLPTVIKLRKLFTEHGFEEFDLNTEIESLQLKHLAQMGPIFWHLLREVDDLRTEVDRLEDNMTRDVNNLRTEVDRLEDNMGDVY